MILTVIGTVLNCDPSQSGLKIMAMLLPLVLEVKFIIKPVIPPSSKNQTR